MGYHLVEFTATDKTGAIEVATFEDTEFAAGGLLYVKHVVHRPVHLKKVYHPTGVDGNFVNDLGFVSQDITFTLQAVGELGWTEEAMVGTMNMLEQSPFQTQITVNGYVQTWVRCILKDFELVDGPRGLVTPGVNPPPVRMLYNVTVTAQTSAE